MAGCLPGSPLSCSAWGPRLVTPCKMPSPAPAALPGTTASAHRAGEAGRRCYPDTGPQQDRALLPGWAELAQVASHWEVRPGAPPAPTLRHHCGPGVGGPEPGGTSGRRARRSHGGATTPASPPSLESTRSVSARGSCQEHAAASPWPKPAHLPAVGARGWARRLTCTLMRTVAVACSP